MDTRTVRDYYELIFSDVPQSPHVLNVDSGDEEGCTDGDVLHEMPLDSNCGENCKAALDHASNLIGSIRMAFGDSKPQHITNILSAAVDACGCYIRG